MPLLSNYKALVNILQKMCRDLATTFVAPIDKKLLLKYKEK
jgi:hypothetical protein